jgi:putative inorganic carbon (HCO3(-)) transporter
MRDYLLFGVVFALLPAVLKNPAVGVLMFTWLSLMNPHRLTYGAAFNFPFAAIVACTTVASLLAARHRIRLPMTPVTIVLILFMVWMTLTGFSAFEQQLAWTEWNRVMKTLVMVLVALSVLNSEKEIKAFAWVVGLSLGFYGLKGGFFTLMTGGADRVLGPAESYIEDNNDLALALITTVPIIWYLQLHASKKWLRVGLIGLAVATIAAAVGSYSRGGLLAAGAMLFFLWLKGQHKLRAALLLLLVVPLMYSVMPEKWFTRMETISDYQTDESALGRINSWYFATNVAKDNIMGGGYRTFTGNVFAIYAPDSRQARAPHSIYFQVLGEHGFIGLALFLVLMAVAWRTGTRLIKFCREKPNLKWASDLARMCQVSIVGYAVGGTFLSLAYYDLYYDIVVLLVLLEKLLLKPRNSEEPMLANALPLPHSSNGRGEGK